MRRGIDQILDKLGLRPSRRLGPDDIANGRVLIVINHKDGGFFAQLNWCLGIMRWCEDHDVQPQIQLISENYGAKGYGDDWLPRYFVWNHLQVYNNSSPKRKYIWHLSELGDQLELDIPLEEANRIFFKYLSLHPAIIREVDAFWQAQIGSAPAVGIHYRGTDKHAEAPRLAYQVFLDAALKAIADNPALDRVFVSTDEAGFIDFLKQSPLSDRLRFREDSARSTDSRPVHLNKTGNQSADVDLGRDALVNGLLLSRCSDLVRGSSFLSAWSCIFNPAMKPTTLNVPIDGKLWYPEIEILRRAQLEKQA